MEEVVTDDELIADIQEKVRTGKLDLRDMGVVLGLGFDQDIPARILALARRGAAVKWRPIEEAPKDGSVIMLRHGDYMTQGGWWKNEWMVSVPPSAEGLMNCDTWASLCQCPFTPTLFIPLSALGEPET